MPPKEGQLVALIRKTLRENRTKPPPDKDTWLRVSSLASLCAREEVICSREGTERDDKISGDLGLIFEHGHGLHWALQNRILPRTGVLLGRWQCMSCGHTTGGAEKWYVGNFEAVDFEAAQAERPPQCAECDSVFDIDNCIYVEQTLVDEDYRLGGHPDGFLRLDGFEGLGVLEAKSISPTGAREVKNCPKLDHVVQAHSYMWLTGLKWAKILYWNKGGYGPNTLIEHTVEYDDEMAEQVKLLLVAIWEGIGTGFLPDRICGTRTCERAGACPVADECFSR